SSVRRAARIEPAEPAPRMMWSYFMARTSRERTDQRPAPEGTPTQVRACIRDRSNDLDQRLATIQCLDDHRKPKPTPDQQLAAADVSDANPDDRRSIADARPAFGEVLILGDDDGPNLSRIRPNVPVVGPGHFQVEDVLGDILALSH